MSQPLEGRSVIVTGGTRGIGRATAEALVRAGASVLIVARGEAEAVAGSIGAAAYRADVADDLSIEALRAHADALGDTHAVVHAAGAFALSAIGDTGIDDFDRMMSVNARAAFLLMRAFVPSMIARGDGHFLSIGSIAGRAAFPANGAYSASKFALRGLHAVLDAELRGTGVRSTLIEPAATDTPLWDAIDRSVHDTLPERTQMLDAAAVADAVLYALTRPPATAVRNITLERN